MLRIPSERVDLGLNCSFCLEYFWLSSIFLPFLFSLHSFSFSKENFSDEEKDQASGSKGSDGDFYSFRATKL